MLSLWVLFLAGGLAPGPGVLSAPGVAFSKAAGALAVNASFCCGRTGMATLPGRRVLAGVAPGTHRRVAGPAPLLLPQIVRGASGTPDALSADAGPPPPGARREHPRVRVEREIYLMGSPCTLAGLARSRPQGLAALERAVAVMQASEAQLSTWRQESALSRLNRARVGEPIRLAPDLLDLLLQVRAIWKETAGAFDPAVGRLIQAWDLRGSGRVPTDEERQLALSGTGMDLLKVDRHNGTATRLAPGPLLDAGGFGKGAALAAAAGVLQDGPLEGWSINLGGQILAASGAGGLVVDVADPDERQRQVLSLRLRGESVATSGNSERGKRLGGQRQGHILDPRTGEPAREFGSVTVVSEDPVLADALSTALYVMGPEQGLRFAQARADVEALFLVRKGAGLEIRATAGIEARRVPSSRDVAAPAPSSLQQRLRGPSNRSHASSRVTSAAPGAVVAAHVIRQPQDGAGGAPSAGVEESRLKSLEEQVLRLTTEMARWRATPGVAAPGADELARRMEVLSTEIEQLQTGAAPVVAAESAHGMGPAASKIYRTEKGVSLGGYGEMIFQGFDAQRDDGTSSGKSDQFDLLRGVTYIGYKLSDRILFNSEIEFEHASTDARGESALEFAYLDFLFKDQLNARAGLLLMPMGFINEQHEPPTFLGARRPDVERFLIPATWRENGFGVFGRLGPVSYRAYLVNGFDGAGINNTGFTARGLRGGRQDGSQALAEDLALVSRVDWTIRPGFTVGGSYYFGNAGQGAISPTSFQSIDARTRIHELHGEWNRWGLNARILYVGIDLDDAALLNDFNGFTGADSIGSRMTGGYFQIGYDLLARRNTEASLVPFVRVESFDTQDRVPAGFISDPANDIDQVTYGLSFKPLPRVVFKVDYQNIDNEAGSGTDQFNFGMGWLF